MADRGKCRLMVFPIFISLGFSGCVIQRAVVASNAKTELVGMSKKDLYMCAGVPARQDKVDDMEFLTYSSGGDSVGVAAMPTSSLMVAKKAHRYCEVTFALRNEKVEKVSYQGRTGGLLTSGEQCAFLVKNCLENR